MFRDFKGRIIWSADGLSPKQLTDLLSDPAVDFPKEEVAIKLDRLFFEQYGKFVIRRLQDDFGIPVFVDAKIIEIPSKTLAIAQTYLQDYQPWMLNVMAGACSTGNADDDLLSDFAQACAEVGTRSCAVTVLTSKTSELVIDEFNGREPADQVNYYAKKLQECGLTDIVCSPKEIDIVKQYGLDINTPGVRLAASSTDDQARVDTPHNAIANGARRIVVGRDIYRADRDQPADIVTNIAKIVADLDGQN